MWKPIETAPKDKPILVFTGHGWIYMAEWEGGFNARGWCVYIDGGRIEDATHWAPIPEPPTTTPSVQSSSIGKVSLLS